MTSLYCILAREADTGVIFRRGPSKQIAVIGWNLKTHTFELGQWFKGQIYVRKSDLSPDGTKLVYFAARHHGKLPTWVAVSNAPYLTALVLWPTMGTYDDLSMFETDTMLALSTYRYDSSIDPAEGFAIPRQLRVKRKPWPGYFHRLADHDRLIRDGWSVHEGEPVYNPKGNSRPVVYRKTVIRSAIPAWLQMSAFSASRTSYVLCSGETSIDLKADWAEIRGRDIFYSQGGKLLRIGLSKSGEMENPVELADFGDMTFEAVESPERAKHW